MISLNKRIQAFETLGKLLLKIGQNNIPTSDSSDILIKFNNAVKQAVNHNGWFIEDNVRYMFTSIGRSLDKSNIEKWIEPYKHKLINNNSDNKIAVVMAGNIPIVGFHDFLTVLMSGNKIIAKLSHDDNKLLPLIADLLINIESEFNNMIHFTYDQLKDFDAIIATGSNNTSRYFEYYFGKYPNIIRKNRNGIAVLTGNESKADFQKLSTDIFMFYGLGCRNVSHIIVPEGYNFIKLLDELSKTIEVNQNHKYFNNYEYNKAIYLVNGKQHYDTGNILLTEDSNFSSPVSVIYYDYYSDINLLNKQLQSNQDFIQCIVSVSKNIKNSISPGKSQEPELWDYADGIDTMKFLIEL